MSDLTILIEQLPSARDLPLPAYMSEQAAGMDLRAAVPGEVTVAPGERALIPAGIRIAVPPGYEAQVRPRSGLAAKHGVTVLNTPGTIDADYRGEVAIIRGNIGREPFTIVRGARIAQLIVQRVARAEWVLAASLPETNRSTGGFGHTGV